MEKDSYSRAEVLAARDGPVERGAFCDKCRARIPVFEDLSDADEQRVRQLISEHQHLKAMVELRAATGSSLSWAKQWVLHNRKPNPLKEPAPCP